MSGLLGRKVDVDERRMEVAAKFNELAFSTDAKSLARASFSPIIELKVKRLNAITKFFETRQQIYICNEHLYLGKQWGIMLHKNLLSARCDTVNLSQIWRPTSKHLEIGK